MEESKVNSIIKLILGEEFYTRLITDIIREYGDTKLKIHEAEPILESYFKAILLIGFSKKKIEIDYYKIHLNSKQNIEINTKKFCRDYEAYINKIENFKIELLKQLLNN